MHETYQGTTESSLSRDNIHILVTRVPGVIAIQMLSYKKALD